MVNADQYHVFLVKQKLWIEYYIDILGKVRYIGYARFLDGANDGLYGGMCFFDEPNLLTP